MRKRERREYRKEGWGGEGVRVRSGREAGGSYMYASAWRPGYEANWHLSLCR